jgi:hypothetical protein
MGRIFVMNYDLSEVRYDEVKILSEAIKRTLDDDDELVMMPHTFQLHQLSRHELRTLRDHIDTLLQVEEVSD